MSYLVGIPCLYGAGHTKEAIESVVNKPNVDVILIDNGAEEAVKEVINSYKSRENVFVIEFDTNIYVNPAWNQILNFFLVNPKYDYLCIINSDIIMQKQWKEVLDYLYKVINSNDVLIPTQLRDKELLNKDVTIKPSNFQGVFSGTAGVCILLNRKQAKLVYPIPKYIKVWWGDYWIYTILRKLGYNTFVVDNLLAYHCCGGSQTMLKVEGISGIIEEDKAQWVLHGEKDIEGIINGIKNEGGINYGKAV